MKIHNWWKDELNECSPLCLAHVYLIIVVFQMNHTPAFVFVERMYKKACSHDGTVIADMWWCHIFIPHIYADKMYFNSK